MAEPIMDIDNPTSGAVAPTPIFQTEQQGPEPMFKPTEPPATPMYSDQQRSSTAVLSALALQRNRPDMQYKTLYEMTQDTKAMIDNGQEDDLRAKISDAKKQTDIDNESHLQEDILNSNEYGGLQKTQLLRQSMEIQQATGAAPIDQHAVEKEGVSAIEENATQDTKQAAIIATLRKNRPSAVQAVHDNLVVGTALSRALDQVQQEEAHESWPRYIMDFLTLPMQSWWTEAHGITSAGGAWTPGGTMLEQSKAFGRMSTEDQLKYIPTLVQNLKNNSGLITSNNAVVAANLQSYFGSDIRDRMGADFWAGIDVASNIGLVKYLAKPYQMFQVARNSAAARNAIAADMLRSQSQVPEHIGGIPVIHQGTTMLDGAIPDAFRDSALVGPGPGIVGAVYDTLRNSAQAVAAGMRALASNSRKTPEQMAAFVEEAKKALEQRLRNDNILNVANEGLVFGEGVLPEDVSRLTGLQNPLGNSNVRLEESTSEVDRSFGARSFKVHVGDEHLGNITATYRNDTKDIHIEGFFQSYANDRIGRPELGASNEEWQAYYDRRAADRGRFGRGGVYNNVFNRSELRDLFQHFKVEYPEAETISGFRVGGARRGIASNTPEVGMDASMRIPPARAPRPVPDPVYEISRNDDTGLHYLSTYVRDFSGYGGHQTEEMAQQAILDRGWHPDFAQTTQMPDGSYAVKLSQIVREDGVFTPVMTTAARPWGRVAEFWKNANDMRDESFQGSALRATGVEAAIWQQTLQPLIKRVTAVKGQSKKALQALIDLGNQEEVEGQSQPGKWYNWTEFNTNFERITNRAPTEKEAIAYYSLKQIRDLDHYMKNRGLYIDAARRGEETVTVNTPRVQISARNGRIAPENVGIDTVRFMDAETGTSWGEGKSGDYKQLLQSGNYKLIELAEEWRPNESAKIGPHNQPVKYILAHNDAHTIGPLNPHQLEYVGGTPTRYTGHFYTKQANSFMADNKTVWMNPLTHANHTTMAGAQKYANAMEQARLAYNQINGAYDRDLAQHLAAGMDRPTAQAEANITREDYALSHQETFSNSAANDYDTFHRLVEEGQISAEHPFEALYRDNEPNAMEKASGIRWANPNVPASEQIYRTRKGMFYSAKGERLRDENGKVAGVVDPWRSTQYGLESAIKTYAWGDYNTKVMEEWVQKAMDAGLMDWKTVPSRTTTEAFLHGQLDQNKMGTQELQELARTLETNRTLHKRLLNMETKDQSTNNMQARRFAAWIDGHGQVSDWVAAQALDLKDKRPLAALKALAYDVTIAMFAPARFVIHTTTSLAAMTVHPEYGLQAAAMTWPIRLIAMNRNPELVDTIANWGKTMTGMEPESFKRMIGSMQSTGRMYMGDASSMFEGYASRMGGSLIGNGLATVRRAGRSVFNEAERVNQITGWQMAWRDALDNHPELEEGSKAFEDYVLRKADVLTNNMSRASTAQWQKSFLGLPGQFHTLQARLIEKMLPKEMGGNQLLSSAQKRRLVIGQLAMYGSAGAPGLSYLSDYVYNQYYAATGKPIDDNTWRVMSQGLVDEAIFGASYFTNEAFGTGKLDVDWAHRVGLGSTLADFANGSSQSVLEMAGGPSVELGGRMANSVLSILSVMKAAQVTGGFTEQEFDEVSEQLAKNLPLFNEAEKSYYIYRYGLLKNPQTGRPLASVDRINAFASALGIPIRKDVKFWEYQKGLEQYDNLIRKQAQISEQYERMAYEALEKGDYKAANAYNKLQRGLMAPFDNPLEKQDITKARNQLSKRGADDYDLLLKRIYEATGRTPPGENH